MKTPFSNWIKTHQLISFFALSYLIMFSVLFSFIYLNPSRPLQPWTLVWFLAIFSPSFSALIIGSITGGKREVIRLLSGFTRWKVSFRWYFAAAFLFIGPLVIALIYIVLGKPISGLKPGETLFTLLGTIAFTLFSGPIAEEMGWRGFALPRLQAKYNALVSSLILGVIWTCWHIPLFFVTGATQMSIPFPIYLVLVITITIYLTWLYNNTKGSLIITVLAHFLYNMTGFLTGPLGLMPPMVFYMTAGPLLGLLVIAGVFVFGPRYLSKKSILELPFHGKASADVSAN